MRTQGHDMGEMPIERSARYVSFLIGETFTFDQASGDTGILYSPSACQDAVKISELAFK
jgi:uncharacterized protein YcsI (UPF0317 family)